MKNAIVITGQAFDWNTSTMKEAIEPDGSVNWRAAHFADPGVTSCPKCKTFYWKEGEVLECPECGTQWNVRKQKGDAI